MQAPDGKSELLTQVRPFPQLLAQDAVWPASGLPPDFGMTPNGGKLVEPPSVTKGGSDGHAPRRGRQNAKTGHARARQSARLSGSAPGGGRRKAQPNFSACTFGLTNSLSTSAVSAAGSGRRGFDSGALRDTAR